MMKYRHELKYAISQSERAALTARLHGLIARDENVGELGQYKIRSLYFDDYFHTAYADKIAGVYARAKYRIRYYNDNDAFIRLERKLKRGNHIAKQSVPLTRVEADAIVAGDCRFLLGRDEPFCAEFYYEYVTKTLRPQVIVDYEREPFVFRTGDVRVTFDNDVRALPGNFPLFSCDQRGVMATEPDLLIMEVKYTELLPRQIRAFFPSQRLQLEAFSKYTACCDALNQETIPLD